ncbi:hypothetical protein DFQ29_003504, partial [Apophysomyces sp. BC1021]
MAREPKTAQDDELSAIAGKLLYQAPRNLPLFQWHGVPIQDETKTVFANAFDFMTNFEVILKSNRLSLDENWECLLPVCLSTYQLIWFREQLAEKNLSWDQVKQIIERDYIKTAVSRDASQVWAMRMKKSESVQEFFERFWKARVQHNVRNDAALAQFFIGVLPKTVCQETRVIIRQQKYTMNTVEEVMEIVKTVLEDESNCESDASSDAS